MKSDPLMPPTVADAEQVIADLQSKRAALVERGNEMATIRASYAYAAHARGDETARRKLDAINKETAEHASELASIDAALVTAQQRLDSAKRYEAKQADRERAKVLREAMAQFVQHAAALDNALAALVSSCNAMQESLMAVHRSGSQFPSDAQLMSLGGRVLLAALSRTPFRRDFETLPPDQRLRTMSAVVAQWADTVERALAQRLGEQTIEAAE
jgi:hypothetical protein